MRRALSMPVSFADREIAMSASVGLALYDPQLHSKRDDMLKDAEIAMRRAKKGGGNRVEVFRPMMRAQRNDRLTLETDLRRALERGEMKVYFQPVVRLEDRTVAGFEALLRWDHPRLGRLGPAEFIPIAEETGRHHRPRHFRAREDRARTRRMAEGARRRSADLRQRQRLVAAAPAPRSAAGREERPHALGRPSRHAEAGTHRDRW